MLSVHRQVTYVIFHSLGGEDDDDETNCVYSLNSAIDSWQPEEDMVTGITETTVYSSYAVATIPD